MSQSPRAQLPITADLPIDSEGSVGEMPLPSSSSATHDASAQPGSLPISNATLPVGSVLDLLVAKAGPVYQCPGETGTISHAVHLSRLANFYSLCRDCPHATGLPESVRLSESQDLAACVPSSGESPSTGSPSTGSPGRQIPKHSSPQKHPAVEFLKQDGIRGTYLTELARPQAEELAAACAAVVWQRFVRRGRDEDDLIPTSHMPAVVPTMIVSRDGSSAGPDLARGVVRGLRRMGVHVVDLGVISRPTLDFAVFHWRADAGLHLTGAGFGSASSGFDLVDHRGVPWSQPGLIGRVREVLSHPTVRPTRRGGDLRSFDIEPPARAEFQRYGHGLRQSRIGIAAECPQQQQQILTWCGSWPITLLRLPPLSPVTNDDAGRHLRRQIRQVRQEFELQWLARIGPDGREVQLIDERGQPVDPAIWLVRLAEHESPAKNSRRIVVGADFSAQARGRLQALGFEVQTTLSTHESIVQALLETQAMLAADGHGRIWFQDHYPVCDGLVTVAHLAHLACRANQPVSHWAT